jgi:hypothetical protein
MRARRALDRITIGATRADTCGPNRRARNPRGWWRDPLCPGPAPHAASAFVTTTLNPRHERVSSIGARVVAWNSCWIRRPTSCRSHPSKTSIHCRTPENNLDRRPARGVSNASCLIEPSMQLRELGNRIDRGSVVVVDGQVGRTPRPPPRVSGRRHSLTPAMRDTATRLNCPTHTRILIVARRLLDRPNALEMPGLRNPNQTRGREAGTETRVPLPRVPIRARPR